jgi:hypothetical protein
MADLTTTRASKQHFSIPSILAIICAVVSFTSHAGWGFFLAIAAIILGVIGFLIALMPGVRGGIVSMISIVAGLIGIIAAILKLIF